MVSHLILTAFLLGSIPFSYSQLPKTGPVFQQLLKAANPDSSAVPDSAKVPPPQPAGSQKNETTEPQGPKGVLNPEQLQAIQTIATTISQNYVDPLEAQKIMYEAMKGMARKLDPYSTFLSPDEVDKFMKLMHGEYFGIGICHTLKEIGKPLHILYAFPGSPAQIAGIQPNDEVLKVDGVNAEQMNGDEIHQKIVGAPNTTVTLTILRTNNVNLQKQIEITVARANIEEPTLFAKMLNKDVGYIYLSSFQKSSPEDFDKALHWLLGKGMKSLVFDLRFNPGGNLDSALGISVLLLRKGDTIISVKDRQGNEQSYTDPFNSEHTDLRTVLLINGHSASASEVVAVALKDNNRATVIGSDNSFGKGVVQSMSVFQEGILKGSAIKITTERYYSPLGYSVEKDPKTGRRGVAPHILVKVDPKKEAEIAEALSYELSGKRPPKRVRDEVLEKALEVLRQPLARPF
ncbi:MAG: S41 family peptidase [Elusimicrobia bacterium]|nr:S41 family peptidase [Elusimicrobiota bacterium]